MNVILTQKGPTSRNIAKCAIQCFAGLKKGLTIRSVIVLPFFLSRVYAFWQTFFSLKKIHK